MAQIQVVLIKDVSDLGKEGEFVRVKLGYFRNFLFPQKIAVMPGSAEAQAVLLKIKNRKTEKSLQIEVKKEKKIVQEKKRQVMKEKKKKLLSKKTKK